MSETLAAPGRPRGGLSRLVGAAIRVMASIPYSLIALIARLSIAGVFWQSGRTKVEDWRVTDGAIELFRSDIACRSWIR